MEAKTKTYGTRDYLKTFFIEKELETKNFEIEGKMGTNYISSDVVIESILNTSGNERKKNWRHNKKDRFS